MRYRLVLYKSIFAILIILTLNISYTGQVHFIDVGQGKAILITMPYAGTNILIDTGPPKSSSEVNKYLAYYGVNNINTLIVTHLHDDHYGGYEYIKIFHNVDNLYFNRPLYGATALNVGDILNYKYGNLKVINSNNEDDNENNNSLSFVAHLRNKTYLFTGDIELDIESGLVDSFILEDIDVLDVGHHGSQSSSSQEFITALKPETCIISSGQNNQFGHPHISTIETLEKSDCKIKNTQTDGNIILRF